MAAVVGIGCALLSGAVILFVVQPEASEAHSLLLFLLAGPSPTLILFALLSTREH